MTHKELYELAVKARHNAYAPYSSFKVGAALLCADGSVYTGCNIENAAFSPTVCAERVAVFKAVSSGKYKLHADKRDFMAIAIAGGRSDADIIQSCYPCGVCRQVLAEFCTPGFIVVTSDGAITLGELLPRAFEF